MKQITKLHGQLLEGGIWDEKRQKLYFLDIEKFRIYRFSEPDKLEKLQMSTYVSSIVLKKDGSLLAALQDGLYEVDFDKGSSRRVMESQFPKNIRYNDGKCDPHGDLWLGSMFVDQTEAGAEGGGSLFCIQDGCVTAEYPSFTIPNGLDWILEKGLFYHTETSKKVISVYQQETESRGKIGTKIKEIDFSQEKGSPDGMCADRDGNLWVAMWGGSQVIGYNPEKEQIIERIPVPDQNVSCCIFGGKEWNQLFITTARDENGNGGELYTIQLNHCGKAGYRYGER